MTITVNGPNGSTVNFPDETDAATINSVMQQGFAKQAPATPGVLDNAPTAFIHGATLGLSDYPAAGATWLGDKAAAGFGALGVPVKPGTGDLSYSDALRDVRGQAAQFSNQHPLASGATDVAGAVTSPVFGAIGKGVDLGADALKSLSPALTNAIAASRFGRFAGSLLGSAVQGGAAGGAAGALGAQGQDGRAPSGSDILSGLQSGGLGGAAVGSAAPYIGGALGWTGRQFGNFGQTLIDKLPFNQPTAAGRALAKTLGDDSLTPAMLEANRAAMGGNVSVVDAAGNRDPNTGVWLGGKNTFRAADALANQPGPTQDLAERVMKPRAAQSGLDLIDSIQTNLAPGSAFHDTIDTLTQKQSDEASPLFQNAFKQNQSVADPRIDKILLSPAGQEAMDYARTRVGNKLSRMAVPDPELTEQYNDLVSAGKMEPGQTQGGVASGLKLKTLDLVRQNLGEQLAQKRLQVAKGDAKPSEAGDLGDLYGDFRQALIDNDVTAQAGPNSLRADGGDYEKGLKAYSGPAQLKDAMQSGRDFMKGDRELAVKDFTDMSPGEQNAFRLGAARTVQGTIEQNGTVPKALQNILNPANKQRQLMQSIFPNFDQFLGDVGTHVRQGQSARMISGSDTAARMANQADLLAKDLGGAGIDLVMGDPVGAVGRGARGFMRVMTAPSQGAQNQLGSYLVDPSQFDSALAALRQHAQIGSIGNRLPPPNILGTPPYRKAWQNLAGNYGGLPLLSGGIFGAATAPGRK